jgi:hypothetical protein
VQLSANAQDPDGVTLVYTFKTTGGKIKSDGPNATLDLTGVAPGFYTVTVEVDDGCGRIAFTSTLINVERCNCPLHPPPPCPSVSISCPDRVMMEQTVTFVANVSGGDPNVTPTFKWTVPGHVITSGQGTSAITVEASASGGEVVATVELGGYDRSCIDTASCTTSVTLSIDRGKIDEYGNIPMDDEKARLDNYAIELQNDPTAQGYLICYGGRVGYEGEAQRRCDRAKDYLVNTRGISAERIVTLDGGYKEDLTVELWLIPAGAAPPRASPTVDPAQVKHLPRRRTSPQRPSRRVRRFRRRRSV